MSVWDDWKQNENKGIIYLSIGAIIFSYLFELFSLTGLLGKQHIAIALFIGARYGGAVLLIFVGIKVLLRFLIKAIHKLITGKQ